MKTARFVGAMRRTAISLTPPAVTSTQPEPSPAVSKLLGAVRPQPSALPPSSKPSYAGAALLKGRDPKSGLDVEVLSVSGQVGTQEEWQAGFVRLGRSTSAGLRRRRQLDCGVVRGRWRLGVRDLDNDGERELCAKVSHGLLTVGACVETPF